jgi:hypothetical protein
LLLTIISFIAAFPAAIMDLISLVYLAPFVFMLPSKFLIFQLLMNATRTYLLVFYAACLTYNFGVSPELLEAIL